MPKSEVASQRSTDMSTDRSTKEKAAGRYAEVNGINLYYEIHGAH